MYLLGEPTGVIGCWLGGVHDGDARTRGESRAVVNARRGNLAPDSPASVCERATNIAAADVRIPPAGRDSVPLRRWRNCRHATAGRAAKGRVGRGGPPGAGASAAVRARPFAAVPAPPRPGTRFLRTQPAESGGSVFFLAGPRSPSFRRIVSRGTIASVATCPAQLLHILVPSPHRLARVRRIGEDEAAGLAGIAARTRRAACGGGRPRDATATA